MSNIDPTNSTQMVSDTLFTFSISPSNGTFALLQKFPAGGIGPRAFSINGNGTMVAVALNISNRLAVIARDAVSGLMTGILGLLELDVGAQGELVTSAIWDEEVDDGGNTGSILSSLSSLLAETVTPCPSAASVISSPAAPAASTSNGYSGAGNSPSPTSAAASPPSGAAVATPTPFQAGMVGDCTKFYLVVSGDTCNSIATAAGINISDFYTWNPAVGSSCATLFLNNNVCIGVGS
jgi:Lactonase, 7-bladed beta-propeller/LysM domain